jgi:hypothetical protein
MTLNEQIKNNGCIDGNFDMVMNLDREKMTGRSLDAFVNERRAQEV